MTPPLCRYCAKPITKRFTRMEFGGQKWQRPEVIFSKEEARRLSNNKLVSVKTDGSGRVRSAKFWDGESYMDDHFCKDRCAQFFGRMVARDKPGIATQRYFDELDRRRSKQK